MMRPPAIFIARKRFFVCGTLGLALASAGAVSAQAQSASESAGSVIDGLRACRAITDETQRLACYDNAANAVIASVDTGEVRVVDREEVRKTRRQLFGINMPDIDILKDDGKDGDGPVSDLFETVIADGRQTSPTSWRFTTVEGAVWEINNPTRKIASIKSGDKVVFKKASLGYYFIRINGQIGVKGRRVS